LGEKTPGEKQDQQTRADSLLVARLLLPPRLPLLLLLLLLSLPLPP